MMRGKCIGVVWATRKVAGLMSHKLSLVAEYSDGAPTGRVVVAIDTLDSDPCSDVIVSFGSGARRVVASDGKNNVLAEAAISERVEGESCS